MINDLKKRARDGAIPNDWLYPLYRIFWDALQRGAPWWTREDAPFKTALQAAGALEEPLLAYLSHLEEPDPPPLERRDADREQREFDLGRARIEAARPTVTQGGQKKKKI